MKRWLAILFLSLGTTILVAHAAFPHHHHEGVICYHHEKNESHAQEASHAHGPIHPLDFNCTLKQFYLAPAAKREIPVSTLQVSKTASSQVGLPVVMHVSLAPGSFPLKLLSYYSLKTFPDPAILRSSPRAPPLS